MSPSLPARLTDPRAPVHDPGTPPAGTGPLPDPSYTATELVAGPAPRWWRSEVELVREHAARLPVKPWDPATLPPPDPVGVEAGRLVAASVALSRRYSLKKDSPLSPLRHIAMPRRRWCSTPVGVVVVDPTSGSTSALKVPCDRLTCPECRAYNREAWAERIVAAFDGLPMYREEVAADEWTAWKARADRRGARRVAVPAFDGGRVVFTTAKVGTAAELVADEGRTVREALEARPFGGRRRVRSTPGFVPALSTRDTAEAAPDPARLEVVGWWNPREGIDQAAAAAQAVGLRVRRYTSTPRVVAGFALEGIAWYRDRNRPEMVRFLRAIAFEPVPQAAALPGGRWEDDPVLHRRRRSDWEPPPAAYTEPPCEEVA